jgi:hypothetical protein
MSNRRSRYLRELGWSEFLVESGEPGARLSNMTEWCMPNIAGGRMPGREVTVLRLRENSATIVLVPWSVTSKYADALAEFAAERRMCAYREGETDSYYIEFQLAPTDAGLTALLGGQCDPAWHLVHATMRGDALVALDVCFAPRLGQEDTRFHGGEPSLWSSPLYAPVTMPDLRANLALRLAPQSEIYLFPANHIVAPPANLQRLRDALLPGFDFRYCSASPVAGAGYLLVGPSQHRTAMLTRIPRCFPAVHCQFTTHKDVYLRGQTRGWTVGYQWREIGLLKSIIELCLAFDAQSYVVLWIFNWLPRVRLHRDVRKLRWIEAIQASIARVRARRKANESALATYPRSTRTLQYAATTQPDVCLFMLGVFDTRAGARMKKTDAFIDASAYPLDQLALHNNALTCPRERRAFVGQWKMCVIVCVPTERRLDVTALKMFWRRRSRTLEKRIEFGIRLARALQLVCYADQTHLADIEVARPGANRNTLSGPPLCRANESICFTLGSPSAAALARAGEQRAASAEQADGAPSTASSSAVDWEHLAHLLLTEPSAALDATSQARQANALEMMLHAADPAARRAAAVLLRARRDSGSLARVDRGVEPFAHLRDAVHARCIDESGELSNQLIFEHSDECYDDAAEFMARPLKRLRLHRAQMCVCGARGTLTRRVRVRRTLGAPGRLALECSECGRNNAASMLYVPSVGALRSLIGAPEHTPSDAQALEWFAANAPPSVSLDRRPPVRLADAAGIEAALDGAVRQTNEL